MLERFDRYMERCLYDPEHGFYRSGAGIAGRRGGDFITSPEVGPLFVDVLANALDDWWDRLGRPDPFTVYDAGTGPGTLAAGLDVAGGSSADARRVVGVDRNDDGGTDLPADLTGAVVIGNELLDNLPFRVVERTVDGWSEVWVDTGSEPAGGGGPDGATETLRPLPTADNPAILERSEVAVLPLGTRLPLLEQAHDWIADVRRRTPGAIVVFDYGAPTTVELGLRGGWLRTYRQHQRSDEPYRDPGRWDITTDVAVDQLPTPSEVVDQAAFLRRWGIERLVEEGRAHWQAHAAAPDLAAFKMRSRVQEAEALLDPSGLGGWLACTWLPPAAS